ncbi:MAG: hypothetical protein HeimC2_07310 [Candidatus Heimdallarchaeota archaeon LC_2]|nr:MAG: hypothetical protein HeimC2_07310 [Candidatus Heimdallarchaeota archaeon LC_2]
MNMTLEPPPLLEIDFGNFIYQNNSDLEMITEEMLEYLKKNGVEEEWLITIIQGLYLCNSDQ